MVENYSLIVISFAFFTPVMELKKQRILDFLYIIAYSYRIRSIPLKIILYYLIKNCCFYEVLSSFVFLAPFFILMYKLIKLANLIYIVNKYNHSSILTVKSSGKLSKFLIKNCFNISVSIKSLFT